MIQQAMKYILILILCLPAFAQQGAQGVLIQFAEQGTWLDFVEYSARICNTTAQPQSFTATIVKNAAGARGINAASYSKIQRVISAENRSRTSTTRTMLSVAEAGGLVMGVLTSTGAIWKPAANWQKALPITGAGAIRLATTLVARHAAPEAKLPQDLLPVFINLPAGAGACVEHTMPAIPNAEIGRGSAR